MTFCQFRPRPCWSWSAILVRTNSYWYSVEFSPHDTFAAFVDNNLPACRDIHARRRSGIRALLPDGVRLATTPAPDSLHAHLWDFCAGAGRRARPGDVAVGRRND